MIGIIYKFTILAKIKRDGHKPFYIGQHWEKRSIEYFLSRDSDYYGSGTIWLDSVDGLRRLRPDNWKSFIKREVLYGSDRITQRGLDALEEHFIKKYKSHYSNLNGGCNVLLGTANGFGSGSPAKDDIVRKKISKTVVEFFKTPRGLKVRKILRDNKLGKQVSDETKKKISESTRGDKSFWYGKHLSEETKEKLRIKAIERYNSPYGKELKKKVSNRKYLKGSEHQFYGKYLFGSLNPFYGRHHSEETKKKISEANKNRRKRYEWNNIA